MIRRVVIHSLDRLRGTDVYVREGGDDWKLVKQIKGIISGVAPVSVRATGDAVRVVPKTDALGVITDVEVFGIPKTAEQP